MREIYIKTGRATEIALTEDGKLCEYLLDEGDSAAEAVYLGRVERIVPGMKAAFVDIGQEKNGFLPLEENSKTAVVSKLQTGDRVLVQVKKEAQGTKGAFLSRDVTLCGQGVIFMPMNRYVGVSSRITEEKIKEGLRAIGRELSGGAFGLIMRASAADMPFSALEEEVQTLRDVWAGVLSAVPASHVPSLIHKPRTMLEGLIDDYASRGIHRIITNDETLAEQLKGVAPVTMAADDLMAVGRLIHQRDKALQRHVWLDSGASLVIDPCEAMTVIDVNTAKFTGKRDLEETILTTNLEACREIVRQVRLRNVSGMILIDMIDMKEEDHRRQVLEALRLGFAADRVKTVVHGYTSLGLIEMTRKRSRMPLREQWMHPCRTCRGQGYEPINEEEHHG